MSPGLVEDLWWSHAVLWALQERAAACSQHVHALQGYVEAAQTFQQESMTQPGIDLAAITDRMEIRKAVQSGNVEDAIERVNDLNPEVCTMPQ